jgi:hypothetical protein
LGFFLRRKNKKENQHNIKEYNAHNGYPLKPGQLGVGQVP